MRNDSANPKIEILPEHIIDQIKAGEVLERPASLLKELLENSIDAGSTEINVHLVENGLDLLSIEDNGHGMSYENLPYAFLRHATSKLKTFEDIYHLHSFGFRGEALASVAASSRLTCTSQPLDLENTGGKIIIHGGKEELLVPYKSSSHGTSLYIKDLFFNTPARLKFIKSKVSEKSALKKMFNSFALANPDIFFTLKWDEKEKEIYRPDTALRRVEQVFFGKITKDAELLWMASEEYDNYKVEVFFTPTTHSTPQYRHHYLFVNNRFFQEKALHQALLRTLDQLWKFGESGHYVVKITAPPEEIDVNVHPNKTQIKFLKSDVVFSLLVTGLKNAVKKMAKPQNDLMTAADGRQENFFTRDENQTMDLMSMSQSSYADSSQGQQQGFQFDDDENENKSSFIGEAAPGLILLRIENKFYVTRINKLLACYLSDSLKVFKENEESAGPLLISEPFRLPKGKVDEHLETLKALGFELDRLNSEVMALRTLPRFIPQSISRDVTQCLIDYFNQLRNPKLDWNELETFIETHYILHSSLSNHVLDILLSNSSSQRALVQLNEESLRGILK